jgi:hypothetical protein
MLPHTTKDNSQLVGRKALKATDQNDSRDRKTNSPPAARPPPDGKMEKH